MNLTVCMRQHFYDAPKYVAHLLGGAVSEIQASFDEQKSPTRYTDTNQFVAVVVV